jgi:hypothetical protein
MACYKGKHEATWNEYLVEMKYSLQTIAQLICKGNTKILLDVMNKLGLPH